MDRPLREELFFCGFPYVNVKSFNFDADFFKANLALIKKTVEGVEVKYKYNKNQCLLKAIQKKFPSFRHFPIQSDNRNCKKESHPKKFHSYRRVRGGKGWGQMFMSIRVSARYYWSLRRTSSAAWSHTAPRSSRSSSPPPPWRRPPSPGG